MKFLRKKSGVWSVLGGGHGGCDRSIEVFVKIKNKIGDGCGRVETGGGGGQGGCERRIGVFVKIKNNGGGGSVGGGRGVDLGEVNFCENSK